MPRKYGCHHNEYDNRPTPFAVALTWLPSLNDLDKAVKLLTRLFVKIKSVSYLNGKMMRTFIPFILCGVSELIRWQQFAPKFSMGSFEGGQVYRKTERIAETF